MPGPLSYFSSLRWVGQTWQTWHGWLLLIDLNNLCQAVYGFIEGTRSGDLSPSNRIREAWYRHTVLYSITPNFTDWSLNYLFGEELAVFVLHCPVLSKHVVVLVDYCKTRKRKRSHFVKVKQTCQQMYGFLLQGRSQIVNVKKKHAIKCMDSCKIKYKRSQIVKVKQTSNQMYGFLQDKIIIDHKL